MGHTDQTYDYYREATPASPGIVNSLARLMVLKSLAALRDGCVILVDGEGRQEVGDRSCRPACIVYVHHPEFYRKVLAGGIAAAAETYRDGLWRCTDLPALLRILLRNRGTQQQPDPLRLLRHLLKDNMPAESRSGMEAHYDLGNDFYKMFLDPSMACSCGVFQHRESTLEEATGAKYDLICKKLRLTPECRVLDIGAGWGGFAIFAARNYGCHVTATTVSRRQYELAARRVELARLKEQVTVMNSDYRDLTGKFDRVVSIECTEAVALRYLPAFFRTCSDRLKPEGAAMIQVVTAPDTPHRGRLLAPDFIRQYLLPGNCSPPVKAIGDAAARSMDLRLVQMEDLTRHYVPTLRAWRNAFHQHVDRIRCLGFDGRFIKLWEYYLCYCEAMFAEGKANVKQIVFAKPEWPHDDAALPQQGL